MRTTATQPTGTDVRRLWSASRPALRLLFFVSALVLLYGIAQAADLPPLVTPSALSVQIRCTNADLKVGDEISIEFIISNHGTQDYKFVDGNRDRSDPMAGYGLTAWTASGDRVGDPRPTNYGETGTGWGSFVVLSPGQSFTNVIPLNRWAFIKAPGQYKVAGTFTPETYTDYSHYGARGDILASASITIKLSPRPQEEMDAYIHGLSNAAVRWMKGHPGQTGPDLDNLVKKLMYTCSPEIVPTLLRTAYEAGAGTGAYGEGYWAHEALSFYVPHTDEVRKAIIAAAASHGPNMYLENILQNYDLESEK